MAICFHITHISARGIVNNYIVRSYRYVIVVTNIATKFKFKFKSVYCISCKVFAMRNSTINQILSFKTYYTTNTPIVNKVTNYITLGVFILDGCMLINHAHHDVHTQYVQYIQDQCQFIIKNALYCFLLLSILYLTISL